MKRLLLETIKKEVTKYYADNSYVSFMLRTGVEFAFGENENGTRLQDIVTMEKAVTLAAKKTFAEFECILEIEKKNRDVETMEEVHNMYAVCLRNAAEMIVDQIRKEFDK